MRVSAGITTWTSTRGLGGRGSDKVDAVPGEPALVDVAAMRDAMDTLLAPWGIPSDADVGIGQYWAKD